MSTLAPNPEQQTAIEAEGRVFLSAGAGTGKTAVLVERFVRAVCDRGIDVGSILVITYTRKAAGELRARIRRELRERGRHDLARELDGAWIATIHGFCARLLRAYPFEAGLDPRFRELDGAQASVLAGEAFAEALDEFCAREEPERLQLLATYGTAALRRMLIGVYETLRSAGRELVLELGERAPLSERVESLRDAVALPRRRHERDRAPARERRGDARPPRRLAVSRPPARPLRAQGARQRAHRVVRGGAQGRSSSLRSTSSRFATATCSRRCSKASHVRTTRRSGARGCSTSRTCSSTRATSSARTRGSASASTCASRRSWSTSSRTRTGSSAS